MATRTSYSKGKRGHKARTEIQLPRDLVLAIGTWKSERGDVVSFASVAHERDGMQTHTIHVDYAKRVIVSQGRATEKYVHTQHALALQQLPAILREVAAQYALAPVPDCFAPDVAALMA
jgi:hypothetical protein